MNADRPSVIIPDNGRATMDCTVRVGWSYSPVLDPLAIVDVLKINHRHDCWLIAYLTRRIVGQFGQTQSTYPALACCEAMPSSGTSSHR